MRELAELALRVAELERRVANQFRHGTVEQVDAQNGLVRLRLGESPDGTSFVGPWVPYAQSAGALKVHSPPSVGQQMTALNPTGDFRQGVALPMTWSDANQSPSQDGNEHKLTFGAVTIAMKGAALTITVGGVTWTLSGDGLVQVGGKIVHDGHLIDKTHQHTEVEPGGGLSGPPP